MCPNCRAFISADDRVCPYCDMKLGQRPSVRRESSDLIAGFIPHAGFTTFVILLLNLGLYAATVVVSMQHGADDAVLNDGTDPATYAGHLVALAKAGRPPLLSAGAISR